MLEAIRDIGLFLGGILMFSALVACTSVEEPTPTPLPAAHLMCPSIHAAHVTPKDWEPFKPTMGLPVEIGPALASEIAKRIHSDLSDAETATLVGLDAN